jgi:Protein of unknown function (DUF2934)
MTRKRTSDNDLSITPVAPVRRKTTARTRAKRPAAPAETLAAAAVQPEAAAAAHAVAAIPAPLAEPSREAIARLAYSYWQARGFQGGSADEDWLRAEQELRGCVTAAVA